MESESSEDWDASDLTEKTVKMRPRWVQGLLAYWKSIMLVLVPLAILPLPLVSGQNRDWCAFMVVIMAMYWMLELLPLAVTSVIPVVLAPTLGILSTEDVSMQYMKGSNMLFVGALILATSIEECNLHRRIALGAIRAIGSSPGLLMLGFMVATSALSMWISNTATSAMMIPIMEVVLAELEDIEKSNRSGVATSNGNGHFDKGVESNSEEKERLKQMKAMLAMAICFSANIGGTGTLIGTGSNVVLNEYLSEFDGNPVSFGTWMAFAIPQMLLCLVAAWLWLYVYFIGFPFGKRKGDDEERMQARNSAVSRVIDRKYVELGPMTFHEWMVLFVFVAALALWFFLSPGFMTGWGDKLESTNAIGVETTVEDATPAIMAAIALFVLPAKPTFLNLFRKEGGKSDKHPIESSRALLDWRTAQHKVEWGIVLLLGGGYALAEASEQSCLSAWIGNQLLGLKDLSDWIISLIGSVLANALTQVASNAAAVSMILPVLRDLALTLEINPLYLMIPPTLACSYAFMLPVSTGPNAICFGPSGISIMTMVKLGLVLNIFCLGIVTLAINTWGYLMFDLGEFPDWAVNSNLGNDTLCDV